MGREQPLSNLSLKNKNQLHSRPERWQASSFGWGLLKRVQCLAGVALMGHLGHTAKREEHQQLSKELRTKCPTDPSWGVT